MISMRAGISSMLPIVLNAILFLHILSSKQKCSDEFIANICMTEWSPNEANQVHKTG